MEFENQYLTYDEYKDDLKGTLSEMPFNLLEYRAEKQVDELTFNRFRKISDYPIELKLCINELITEIKKYNDTGTKSSEKVGEYSANYDRPITNEKKKSIEEYYKRVLVKYKS